MARETYRPDTISDPEPADAVEVTDARQGMRGAHIMLVLVVSLTLAAAALFGLWWSKSGDLASVEDNNSAQPAPAPAFAR